jgi:hypothetical protein
MMPFVMLIVMMFFMMLFMVPFMLVMAFVMPIARRFPRFSDHLTHHRATNRGSKQVQAAGIDQVNNAITNMDEVVQQNAALVEQAAAAAHSLEDKAHDLIDATSKFKLAEDTYFNKEAKAQQKDAHLNEMRASVKIELPNPKSAKLRKHLKTPKANKNEDW